MKQPFSPKVSIVIPVYNGSNYLKEAIDSALAQTYKNIEVIVINDGSNDNGKTDKICKSYGKRIRYFKKENGGVSSALNMGIEKMEGEYFSWLSHDDVYYPEKVEKQITLLSELKERNKVVLYSNYELIDKDGKFLQNVYHKHEELVKKPEYALLRGSVNGITLLIPKSAFDEYGKFDETLKCTQDYEMWRRMIKTFQFVHTKDIITKTRIHALQDTNKNPNVLSEGNALWTSMIEDISDKKKVELEGSIYNYYLEMSRHLKFSPYKETIDHCQKQMEEIRNNLQKNNPTKNIKVSVIIPFFNREDLLLRAIKSVQSQTHSNLEIILVDDASTEPLDKLNNLLKKDKRIILLKNNENKGPAASRNFGISKASGEYVAFLDSDDEFLSNKIEKQLFQVLLTNAVISHTSYIRRYKKVDKIVDVGKLGGFMIPEIITSCRIATPTVMIRTSYLKEKALKFREDIRIGEDTCFWIEILRNEQLLGLEEPLTIVNVGNSSAAYDKEKNIEGLANILQYIFSVKEFRQYHKEISNLCDSYMQISREITFGKESGLELESNLESSNKVIKLFKLFKYQGVPLTIKKIIWKYGPRAINKVKTVINGKR